MWWQQKPTLEYVMEKMLETTWQEHYMYVVAMSEATGRGSDYLVLNSVVQYASSDLRTVLMVKVCGTRTDYLTHAGELAHFAQEWEFDAKKKNLGRELIGGVGEQHRKMARRCHKCGEVGHLRANRPNLGEAEEPDTTLTFRETAVVAGSGWILDSGARCHLVNNAS
ncbi:hypothetical protein PHMEG_00019774 [Phytophthora megakarya]|uniref:Uncharacterized protein n=1 Tax=Phytophthora megakarya TaxID=4795 RepID=A0A225VRM5_9STRA|nr:hypothetical protein PHMEG_00019774 [Phytophthora megakarya]